MTSKVLQFDRALSSMCHSRGIYAMLQSDGQGKKRLTLQCLLALLSAMLMVQAHPHPFTLTPVHCRRMCRQGRPKLGHKMRDWRRS